MYDKSRNIKYTINSNKIKFSEDVILEIEKLTKDSMIVIERIDTLKLDDDKVRKIWFVSSASMKHQEPSNFREPIKKNENFSPVVNRNFTQEIDSFINSTKIFPLVTLKAEIQFFPKEKKIKFFILNPEHRSHKKFASLIHFIVNTIEKTYSDWDLSGFEENEQINIQFLLETNDARVRGKTYYYYYYDTEYKWTSLKMGMKKEIMKENDKDDIDYRKKINNDKAKKEFKDGLIAFQKNEIDKALKHFIKSYENFIYHTDALYNIVAIYQMKNDTENMCKYLKILNDLDQMEGKKLYVEHCLKRK